MIADVLVHDYVDKYQLFVDLLMVRSWAALSKGLRWTGSWRTA